MGPVELHHLRCAVAIADHGSFTEAAVVLHLSQPALSYAIARLEQELNARLFDRTPAGARLTAAGKAFVGPARRALVEAESGKAAVDAVTGVLSGELRLVGIRTAIVETAQLIAAFHRTHPGVRIIVEEPTRDQGVMELVRSGRCDIGVMRTDEVPDDLQGVPAGVREVVVIFPEAMAPREATVTVETLSAVPFVTPLPATSARAGHDAFFGAVRSRPPIAAECSHQDTVVELVRGGLGAAFTSDSRAAAMRTEGIAVRTLRPRSRDELSAVRRPFASPAADAFCAVLVGRKAAHPRSR
jgi:DNA-binding transcriptional LysR family regulator